MKKISLMVLMIIFLLLGTSAMANYPMPGNNPAANQPTQAFLLNSQPVLNFSEFNHLYIVTGNNKFVATYLGQSFPSGTSTQIVPNIAGGKTTYFIQYKIPSNPNWQTITNDMVGLVDMSSFVTQPMLAHPALTSDPSPVLPHANWLPEPFAVVPNFKTGTNIIDPNNPDQMIPLNRELNHLRQNPTHYIILKGEASTLGMNVCWVSPDYSYVSTPRLHNSSLHPEARKITGNENCNEALGVSRAVANANWLISQGIEPHRVIPLKYSSWGIRKGSNYNNQAVVSFMIDENRVITTDITEQAGPNPPPSPGCPNCPDIIYHVPNYCGVSQRREGTKIIITMVCIKQETAGPGHGPNQPPPLPPPPPPPPPPPNSKKYTGLWITLAGMTAGGGLGYLGTQIDTEGGQGASGQYGSGGDGGDANFCQDEPWNCVVAGAAVGAGGAYLIYKLRKIYKNKKSAH